jgi:hypothetical protein
MATPPIKFFPPGTGPIGRLLLILFQTKQKINLSQILHKNFPILFSMGDITKAGSNRGDLERELEDILRFAKMTYQRYVLTIEDYTREELEGDLKEYTLQLENFVVPLLERAEEEGLEDIAKEIEGYYKRLIDAIKQRLLEI